MFDKIKAMSAPPGHSLTGEPGKWAWEQPPRFSDPNDAIDFITDKLDERIPQEDMLKMMTAGITIEEIVNQISFKGFMQGQFNPDVAELIKAPLAIYFLGMAAENEIPVRVFNTSDGKPMTNSGLNDIDLEEMMQENNPSLYNFIKQEVEKDVEEEPVQGGFLAVGTLTKEEEK